MGFVFYFGGRHSHQSSCSSTVTDFVSRGSTPRPIEGSVASNEICAMDLIEAVRGNNFAAAHAMLSEGADTEKRDSVRAGA